MTFPDDREMVKELMKFPIGTTCWVMIPHMKIGYELEVDQYGSLK